MSRIHIYKMQGSEDHCAVVRCTHHIPGSENHPQVETEELIASSLDRDTATKLAQALNDAFNIGREYARQR